MRIIVSILSVILISSGCALFSSDRKDENAPLIQLVHSESGRVAKVNPRFVVLTYPFGGVPTVGQLLTVYRNGKKVGELKITGPQRDINTVADIISGEVQENDEVRVD